MKETLGERMRRIRESKGIGVYELMDITGVSSATIYHAEGDIRVPNIITICRLCEGLGCSPNELVPEWMYGR